MAPVKPFSGVVRRPGRPAASSPSPSVAQQKKLQLIMYKSQAFLPLFFFCFSVRARIYFFPAR
jgi:hypothetical protein